jgi:hypothetical protein
MKQARPKILRHKHYFDPSAEPFRNERDAYAPLVWQCRYGGVEVPDHLWAHKTTGEGKKYSDNQAEDAMRDNQFMEAFEIWVKDFENFVQQKGKVQPGIYRAHGYKAPFHPVKELKAGIRAWKLRFGFEPKDSSPAKQEKRNLNRDVTLHPGKGEGKKLRK